MKSRFKKIKPFSKKLLKFCFFVQFMFIFIVVNFSSTEKFRSDVVNKEWLMARSCKTLKWQRPPAKLLTALVSSPGSGNTWMRELLQSSTGIATGSVYIDENLRKREFPAESVSDGRVLVVKTHKTSDVTKFQKAVLLIRNPRDAILAEFNRFLTADHTGEVKLSFFQEQGWINFFEDNLPEWEKLYKVWLTEFKGPLHVVLYEDLRNNTAQALRNVIQFLEKDVSEADIRCAVQTISTFKRMHVYAIDPFTPKMYKEMNDARNRIINLVQTKRLTASNTQLSAKCIDMTHFVLIIILNIIGGNSVS